MGYLPGFTSGAIGMVGIYHSIPVQTLFGHIYNDTRRINNLSPCHDLGRTVKYVDILPHDRRSRCLFWGWLLAPFSAAANMYSPLLQWASKNNQHAQTVGCFSFYQIETISFPWWILKLNRVIDQKKKKKNKKKKKKFFPLFLCQRNHPNLTHGYNRTMARHLVGL